MKLAVTTRISAGFTIVGIFLVIIGITGVFFVSKISNNLSNIVDEMEPMSRLAGDMKTSLLETHQAIISINRTEKEAELPPLRETLEEKEQTFKSNFTNLRKLSSNYNKLASKLANIESLTTNYFELNTQIVGYKSTYLEMKSLIEDSQMELEDMADDLDTALLDLIDSSDNDSLNANLESISSLASDAVIISVEGLDVDDMQTLDIKLREMDAIVTTLKQRLEEASGQVRSNNGQQQVTAISDSFDSYFDALTGSDSLLEQYKRQLSAKLSANNTLLKANEQQVASLKETSDLIVQISGLAIETKQAAESSLNTAYTIILLGSIISIVIAAAIAFWVVQSIRLPLQSVTGMLRTISSGDLSQKIKIQNQDEFGQLSEMVNELVDSLKIIIQKIKDNTHQLTQAAEQTAIVTAETNANINQQRTQTNHILESIEQMTAAVEEVATSAHSTSDEVEKAHIETQSGQEIVTSNIHSIQSLAGEIDNASDVINQLNEYSVNIGNILDVIRGIAEQTNLLALNAAIEAARAGEQGRGFAVVADEVRTLASRTQESTSEIQDMIERLQTGANKAVDVMQGSRSKASSSVEDIQKAGELLNTITQAISSINDMSTDIATNAEEQASVTEEVLTNVNTIANLADQTAEGAESTKTSSERVAALADELVASVNHFKV
jgi:methyl-accepting chemotaxis protein